MKNCLLLRQLYYLLLAVDVHDGEEMVYEHLQNKKYGGMSGAEQSLSGKWGRVEQALWSIHPKEGTCSRLPVGEGVIAQWKCI